MGFNVVFLCFAVVVANSPLEQWRGHLVRGIHVALAGLEQERGFLVGAVGSRTANRGDFQLACVYIV